MRAMHIYTPTHPPTQTHRTTYCAHKHSNPVGKKSCGKILLYYTIWFNRAHSVINVKRKWTQLSCVEQLPASYRIEYMNRSLHSMRYVCVHVCVRVCLPLSVKQWVRRYKDSSDSTDTHTGHFVFLCICGLRIWPLFLQKGVGGGGVQ